MSFSDMAYASHSFLEKEKMIQGIMSRSFTVRMIFTTFASPEGEYVVIILIN